ncbi:Rrf2 family transcriptional regulator [Candidatus Falkowbacteria bacterium]|jgi:Rrf2 family transcriptional regulator, cysteine metabolism repressor|nr:Rrf2 family transcriptional regulator [Candidatus Falkowbacteria bacterium]MBT6573579.1 Rrf2 family transcriptional regulator [Candidatus Falkowbacteria bacterium]MBT7348387.1 Rrf2 family transcriptional regulator [Candidatus Falkowbacteria bacterium]MBT7500659.1 Rrf2 family transcriptional regulator [Candidatus Falkowbacteria bacterium]
MKFSTKAEYGLRAIVHLDKAGKKSVSLAWIADKEKISLSYLERLFASLKKAGLVKADKGVKGGYYLTKPASKINSLQVIEALEGSVAPYECVTSGACCDCKCKVLPIWTKLYKQITKTLKNIKLSEL